VRDLVEHTGFLEQLSSLGDVKFLDNALRGVTWAISVGAEDFDLVPGWSTLRIAKTDQFDLAGVPALCIYFRIKDENEVLLYWIEPTSADPDFLTEVEEEEPQE
jgi:hypothetical protein